MTQDAPEFPDIPGYRVHALLGQGGMSKVFLGVQEKLDREVAIKTLIPGLLIDEQLQQRFMLEARTASRLSHPNIVTIHDVGQSHETCYIIMERLQESLTERVRFRPSGRLEPAEAFRIVRRMASALDYAHRAGVIHRDIKPDNILFRRDGTPVLADFGIARAIHSQSNLTSTGMIIGTPHYMSPEQCRGESIDAQSDLYSLGVVLYEILTGKVPYSADSTAGVLLKHVQSPVPALPPELNRFQPLVARMLAKNKWERAQSGEELIRLIDQFNPDAHPDPSRDDHGEAWYFKGPAPTSPTPEPPPPLDESMILTIKTPSRAGIAPVQHKSKAPLIVSLVSIPLILAAAYFLFFYSYKDRGNKPAETPAAGSEHIPADPERAGETIKPRSGAPASVSGEDTADPLEKSRRLLIVADEYIANKEFDKARARLKEARALHDSPDINDRERKIAALETAAQNELYIGHIARVREALKARDHESAKSALELAKRVKTTPETDALEKETTTLEKRQQLEAIKTAREMARVKEQLTRDDEAFRVARSENTLTGYEKYLKLFPNGRHLNEAQKKHEELKSSIMLEERVKDDTAFELAKKANTLEGYRDYLKTFRAGSHRGEAEALEAKLRDKLLRETENRVTLQQVRFFAGESKAPAADRRKYAAVFDRGALRYVYTEIAYVNNLYRIGAFSAEVRIVYAHAGGAVTQELKGTLALESYDRDGMYWRGMGWPEEGKWPAGNYSVTIYIDGKSAGEAAFTVK